MKNLIHLGTATVEETATDTSITSQITGAIDWYVLAVSRSLIR